VKGLAFGLLLALILTPAFGEEVNGHLETMTPPDGGPEVKILYLWGTPYQMGYAHGKLLGREATDFYRSVIAAMCEAMGVEPERLDEVWKLMEPYIDDRFKEEMRGLADGSGVDLRTIRRAHAIPELSEYHCTFFAAWGEATADGHLHQIRALDYATEAGIQNHPALIIYRPEGRNAFAAVSWVGFIGVVTGMNEKGIVMSEIGDHYGDEKETLEGEPFIFLARRLLEDASTLQEAREIIEGAHRTSSYLYCIGDAKIPFALAFMTCRDFCYVFDPESLPNRQLKDVVYFSMGADSRWNEKIYEILKAKWGRIDERVGTIDVMRGAGTGDLHAVHFDATDMEVWFANAGPDGKPAYEREFMRVDLKKAFERVKRMSLRGRR